MRVILPLLVEWAGIIGATILLVLSPAFRRRRPLVFAYPRREGLVSLGMYVVLIAITSLVFLVIVPKPIPTPDGTPPARGASFSFSLSQLISQIELAFVILLPFVLALLIRRQPWLSAGLAQPTVRAGLELGAGLALIAIFLTNRTSAIINGLTAAEWLYLPAMLIVGLVEEFIFRGFIQLRLMSWLGKNWGWVITSALFSFWHVPQMLLIDRANLLDMGLNLAILFAFGLLLGWIMNKSGNVLGPGIYHGVHNWLQVLL